MNIPPLLQLHINELIQLGHKIDILQDGLNYGIIFRDYSLPNNHWNMDHTDILIIAQPSYPNPKLDMFYVLPGLRLKDGRMPKSGDLQESHCGTMWQRFSWHISKWNPTFDSLKSYIEVVNDRLLKSE